MDTLDDFTVMNIITQCDMRTAFSIVPLICRRMYALYDDVVVARQFWGELRARIEMLAQSFNQKRHSDSMLTAESWRPPLELATKASLGDFVLNIKINAARTQDVAVDALATVILDDPFILLTMSGSRNTRQYISCGLTTTFETACLQIDKTLSRIPIRVESVVYVLCSDNTFGTRYYRETNGDQMLYDLGFGYKYTTLDVTVLFHAGDLRSIMVSRFVDILG